MRTILLLAALLLTSRSDGRTSDLAAETLATYLQDAHFKAVLNGIPGLHQNTLFYGNGKAPSGGADWVTVTVVTKVDQNIEQWKFAAALLVNGSRVETVSSAVKIEAVDSQSCR